MPEQINSMPEEKVQEYLNSPSGITINGWNLTNAGAILMDWMGADLDKIKEN